MKPTLFDRIEIVRWLGGNIYGQIEINTRESSNMAALRPMWVMTSRSALESRLDEKMMTSWYYEDKYVDRKIDK